MSDSDKRESTLYLAYLYPSIHPLYLPGPNPNLDHVRAGEEEFLHHLPRHHIPRNDSGSRVSLPRAGVGGWVGGWVGSVEENEAVRTSYCEPGLSWR